MSFRVRLRLPSSKQEILTLQPPVTIRTLLDAIAPFLDNVPAETIELRLSYPPKTVEIGGPAEWGRDVRDVGINNGQGLIVKVCEIPTDAATPKPTATSSSVPGHALADNAAPLTSRGGLPAAATAPVNLPPRGTSPSKPSATMGQTSSAVRSSPRVNSPARRGSPLRKDEPPEIELEGGSVVLRIMEDDNSCMFNALIYCVGRGSFQPTDLRQSISAKTCVVEGLW